MYNATTNERVGHVRSAGRPDEAFIHFLLHLPVEIAIDLNLTATSVTPSGDRGYVPHVHGFNCCLAVSHPIPNHFDYLYNEALHRGLADVAIVA